ncbi:MAG: DUF932 domain-containing protein, partial [bacterium]|nr:DUF932 domain-containing protein [bacterium]
MGHMIENNDGVAYTGQKPWHGLGNEVDPTTSIDEWKKQSGLIWAVEEYPALYANGGGDLVAVDGRKVLVRDDDNTTLSIVSDNYNVVQPGEVLEFYRDLAEKQDLRIETAGSLMGGKKVWALAKTLNDPLRIMGQDQVDDYVLLATSYDAMMSTVATRTSVRVVCWNTLSWAVGENGQYADVRLPHNAHFNPSAIQAQLGLTDPQSWTEFGENVTELAKRKVTHQEAVDFFVQMLYGDKIDEETGIIEINLANKAIQKRIGSVMDIYESGVGQ